jgi:hypoxanthine-guanine phosphoribosyltransferase
MRCSDILTLNLMVVGILHGAIAFTGELFGAVGVVTAAKYIVSLDVTNHEGKRNLEAKFFFHALV